MDFLSPIRRRLSNGLFKSVEIQLREAIVINNVAVVERLLQKDEQLDSRDISEGDQTAQHRGFASIHYACEYNTQTDIVELLLKRNSKLCNLKANNEDERVTPLHLAVIYSKPDCLSLLLQYQANPNETDYLGETVLMKAAFRGELLMVEKLLDTAANINAADFRGQTALMLAIKGKQIAVVQSLLQRPQLLINQADNLGNTALLKATDANLLDIVYLLLQHPQIDLNLSNQRQETALMLACSKGYVTIVRWLVDQQAQADRTNEDHETAAMIARKHQSINPVIRDQIEQLLSLKNKEHHDDIL